MIFNFICALSLVLNIFFLINFRLTNEMVKALLRDLLESESANMILIQRVLQLETAARASTENKE